jgi:dihydrofolate reductase
VTRAPLALVVAMNRERLIGADGGLPWHIPEDLKHFKRTTMGHAILMGRVTWDSIGRPLPGRHNIVISRNQELVLKGADVVHSVEAAVALARAQGDSEPCIIGGATIYAAALPHVTTLHVTEVDRAAEGDTFFPALAEGEWEEVERRDGETPGVVFLTLKRVGG